MNKIMLATLGVMALLGLFLLGSGMTGMVISESCCIGDGCSAENMCDFARPNLETPGAIESLDVYLGLGLILLSVGLFVVLSRSP